VTFGKVSFRTRNVSTAFAEPVILAGTTTPCHATPLHTHHVEALALDAVVAHIELTTELTSQRHRASRIARVEWIQPLEEMQRDTDLPSRELDLSLAPYMTAKMIEVETRPFLPPPGSRRKPRPAPKVRSS